MRTSVARPVAVPFTVVCAVAFVMTGALPVEAVSPDEAGWWTQAHAPGPDVATAPSDVPPNGLLVQGPASDPVAVAALAFTVPTGAVASTVTLHVASGAVTTPGSGLRLCPLTVADFSPESGGPMTDAPTWNCAQPVPGTATVAGDAWTFPVQNLQWQGRVSVAVLPVGNTDRVVLAAPAQDALGVLTVAPTPVSGPLPDGQTSSTSAGLGSIGTTGSAIPPIVVPATIPSAASDGRTQAPQPPTLATGPAQAAAVLPVAFPANTADTDWGAVCTALVLAAMAITTWNRQRRGLFARPSELDNPLSEGETA